VEVPIISRQPAMDDRRRVGMNLGRARQERQRRQRLEIRRVAFKVGVVWRRHARRLPNKLSLAKIAKREMPNSKMVRPFKPPFASRHSLSAIRYSLSAIHYPLFTIRHFASVQKAPRP